MDMYRFSCYFFTIIIYYSLQISRVTAQLVYERSKDAGPSIRKKEEEIERDREGLAKLKKARPSYFVSKPHSNKLPVFYDFSVIQTCLSNHSSSVIDQ